MSYLVQKEYVKYQCTCGSLKTICNLYFCRHCLELRCGYCLCHEVDAHYCSNCMEHLPATEAKVKKNRCANCFDCPNCFHTLAVRATTRNPEDSSKTPTKHYYLACFFCRWTTRDVGIPDQTVATGNWPVNPNPYAEQLQSYLEYYKVLALREKTFTDKKMFTNSRRPYSTYTDKYGLTSAMARKRAGLLPLPLVGKEKNLASIPNIEPCEASETVELLPDHFFTQAPDLTKITTLEQRHANPAVQPETTSDLYPLSRHFYMKESLRCKQCEHNVSKPEYTPASIRFRIQLSAYYHMPEVRVMTVEPLHVGKECEIILKVTNPTPHLTSIQFRPLLLSNVHTVSKSKSKTVDEALEEQPLPAPKEWDLNDFSVGLVETNTVPCLPPSPFVLPPRDDAAEYDDTADTHSFQDDPKVVVWRKGNKAAIKFAITPNLNIRGGQEVIFGFSMDYSYVNTMPAQTEPRPQRLDISVNMFITPGLVISNQK